MATAARAAARRASTHAPVPLAAALLLACVACAAATAAAPPPPFPPAPATGASLAWYANRVFGSPTRAGHKDGQAGDPSITFASGAGALALATNADGAVYIADGPAIRVLDGVQNAVSTLYSNSTLTFWAVCVDDASGAVYALDSIAGGLWAVNASGVGPGNASLVASPAHPLDSWWTACAVDALGGVLVADSGLYSIVRVEPATGAITTLAGCTMPGHVDGAGGAACLHEVYSLSYDASTNSTLFADYGNETTAGSVRRLSPNGTVSTVLDGLQRARAVLARGTSFHVIFSNFNAVFSMQVCAAGGRCRISGAPGSHHASVCWRRHVPLTRVVRPQVFPSTGAQFPMTLLNWVADLQTGAPPSSLAVSAHYPQALLITASAKALYFIGPLSPPSPPLPPPVPNSPPPPEPPEPPSPPSPPVRCVQRAWGAVRTRVRVRELTHANPARADAPAAAAAAKPVAAVAAVAAAADSAKPAAAGAAQSAAAEAAAAQPAAAVAAAAEPAAAGACAHCVRACVRACVACSRCSLRARRARRHRARRRRNRRCVARAECAKRRKCTGKLLTVRVRARATAEPLAAAFAAAAQPQARGVVLCAMHRPCRA
jgi:hypothetical protein